MTSTEKVLTLVEESSRMSDRQLEEAFPFGVPPFMARAVLAGVTQQLPSDPAELDALLERVGEFCHQLRSDPDA